MSEKYQSGIEYYEASLKEEWARDHQPWHWSLGSTHIRMEKIEAQVFAQIEKSPALEAAVQAFTNAMNSCIERAMKTDADVLPLRRSFMNPVTQMNQVATVAVTQGSQPSQAYFPSESDWKMMLSWGASALRSGMLPTAIKTPEAAAIIALKGRELGIPFMVAVAHIHVINGKPSMSAEMLQALARRNLPGLVMNIVESTNERAEIEFKRPERDAKAIRFSFTIEDAKKANLMGKDVWKQYPGDMCWSRAITKGLRKVCPEALMGISYTPEELGAEVGPDGNVIETTGRKISDREPEPALPPAAQNESEKKPTKDDLGKLYGLVKQVLGISEKVEVNKWIVSECNKAALDINMEEYDMLFDKLYKITTAPPIEPVINESA